MIISRTPFRVSLFGGGTDYPKWYENHGGAVFGFTINKYCYISVRPLPPFFEHRHRIVYSVVENVREIDEIQHPAVRGVLSDRNVDTGLEIHHDGDLPARSGLGSSSSFTVGLINALEAMDGSMIGKKQLAREAIRVEHHVIDEHVGIQDQIWAAFGGVNRIEIQPDGDFDVQPAILNPQRQKELGDHLMLFFTGFSRIASTMAKKQIDNIDNRGAELTTMASYVDQAIDILQSDRSICEIGSLLHDNWMLKRQLAGGVSTPEIDAMYETARNAGAIGGKLLGAGGGGFMVLFVEPDKQPAVEQRLSEYVRVRFDFDVTGSKIVVYEPAGLESR